MFGKKKQPPVRSLIDKGTQIRFGKTVGRKHIGQEADLLFANLKILAQDGRQVLARRVV